MKKQKLNIVLLLTLSFICLAASPKGDFLFKNIRYAVQEYTNYGDTQTTN